MFGGVGWGGTRLLQRKTSKISSQVSHVLKYPQQHICSQITQRQKASSGGNHTVSPFPQITLNKNTTIESAITTMTKKTLQTISTTTSRSVQDTRSNKTCNDDYSRKKKHKGSPIITSETGSPLGTHSQKEESPLSMESSAGPSDKSHQNWEGALQAPDALPTLR